MFISSPDTLSCSIKTLFVLLVLLLSVQADANSSLPVSFNIPLRFEKNIGQAPDNIAYILRTNSSTVLFEGTGFRLVANNGLDGLSLTFVGANSNPIISAKDRLKGVSNYFITDEKNNWQSNVPGYAQVHIEDLYNGIDLVYYVKNGELEFDFIVDPGIDAGIIKMALENTDRVEIDQNGDIKAVAGVLRYKQLAPQIYQYTENTKEAINGSYSVNDEGVVELEIAHYDDSRQLVIDPVLSFSSYYGGSGTDNGENIVFDKDGNVYVAGYTTSPDLTLVNPLQSGTGGVTSAFVARFQNTAEGNELVYASYIGNEVAEVRGIATDDAGNVYLTGSTSSQNFPLVNAFQPVNGGLIDGFLVKLNANGNNLVYSTYFGGACVDRGRGMAVNASSEEVYITGVTCSTDFPLSNPNQDSLTGVEAFLAHFSATGNSLLHSTYLGGSGSEYGYAVDTDDAGNVYVAGNTNSVDFPIATPIQGTHAGRDDVFVTSYDGTGGLRYSTYLGGSGDDYAYRIDADITGNLYLAGQTNSTDFPVIASASNTLTGELDAIVAKIDPTGTALLYSRYLGGLGLDVARDVVAVGSDSALIAGYTTSVDFPLADPLQPVIGGSQDAFYAVLDVSNDTITESSFLGGSGDDKALAVDVSINAIAVAGSSDSFDLPLASPVQNFQAGGTDAFIALIHTDADSDGIADRYDNCPSTANSNQFDKDANGTGDACEPPRVTGLWPASAGIGESISLFVFGDYFDMAPGATQVQVNGIQQSVVQVLSTGMLIARVSVTADLLGRPVTVTTVNGAVSSATIFGQAGTELSITGIWPNSAPVGENSSIFIFGNAFTTDGTTEVYFNGVRQWVVAALSSGMLIVRALGHVDLTGHVQVNTPAGSAISLDTINFIP